MRDGIGKNPILYRTDLWRLISDETYDLNGDHYRHLTRALFERVATRDRCTVCNVHLPSSGVGAATQQRARKRLAEIIGGLTGPVILLGDLNTEGESPSSARGLLRAVGVSFIRDQVDVENGRQPSHWNFGKNGLDDGWLDDIGTREATVIEARLETMHEVSDHNALLAKIEY